MDDILLSLSDAEFRGIVDLVYQRFGIRLSEQKRSLVVGRLSKRVRQLGLSSFAAYLEYIREDRSSQELVEFINRISTNHTFFYREGAHFDFFMAQVLGGLRTQLERDPRYPLRIWSAGCATGEEPYTLAMAILDTLGPLAGSVDWGILATDVSRKALEEAIAGVYSESRIRELPKAWRTRYLEEVGPDQWAVRAEVKKGVLFKRLNLMNESYPFKGQFDVIFCRNVMIYFDVPVRKALVDRLYRYTKVGGYLFVGHSESLPRDTCPYRYISPAIYKKEFEA